ncbi:hypothetical protein BW686_07000 [Pseudomonas syringae]|uniref:DUF1534 domain-containing protein n=1 Tax=Pseudomonas syringae TaxID=317 RepID=A0A244EV34_PSESX|nr:hypothetical protein BW686_07000 [Pseudomonas syringae]
MICASHRQERTQSVQNCMPTLERGYDKRSSGRLSLLTLQRGNALRDAPRHKSKPCCMLKSRRRPSRIPCKRREA